ncbi:MAG: AbrB/MazE/SpoVT family DNA-binding domain-containing protein [Solirubrobacterales bacterium]|nr:AbrB/MazE/SpoVT family DNA-binding domain-containing protein [Solirubrobacterales bacterium]
MRNKLSERGQLTIPKALRERLGMKPGTELEFEADGGRLIISKARQKASLRSVVGILRDGRRTDDVMRELRGDADIPGQ